ncbi:MAG: hypothetical protein ABI599_11500 [Flavobacteriales bacterium]
MNASREELATNMELRVTTLLTTALAVVIRTACSGQGTVTELQYRECLWRADSSTWAQLGVDQQQVFQLMAIRQRYPDTGDAARDRTQNAPSGDRILAHSNEDRRVRTEKDNLGRTLPSAAQHPSSTAGTTMPDGQRADGQSAAPTSGGNTSSNIRTPAEIQEGFNTNPAGDPPNVKRLPKQQAVTLPPDSAVVQTFPAGSVGAEGLHQELGKVLNAAQMKAWGRWCSGSR